MDLLAPSYIEALITDLRRCSLPAMKIQESMWIRKSRQEGFSDDGATDGRESHTKCTLPHLATISSYPYTSMAQRNNHINIVNLITVYKVSNLYGTEHKYLFAYLLV